MHTVPGDDERTESTNETRLWVLAQEYRALYTLVGHRIASLERRVPIVGSVIAAVLGSFAILPDESRLLLLLVLPIIAVWYLRTTISHARSFEDLIRRIDEIEQQSNAIAQSDLILFQSQHPSRGRAVGGRTGTETSRSIFVLTLVLLLSAGWLGASVVLAELLPAYWTYLACCGTYASLLVVQLRRYRYRRIS